MDEKKTTEAAASLLIEMKTKTKKQGQNDPCSCGSGKKFKRCHGT